MKTLEHITKWTRPRNYMGAEWPHYYSSGFGQSRDSDDLEASNFAVVQRELAKLPPFAPPAHDGDNEVESRFVVRESHWAVGWVEWIAIHEADTAALELCDRLKGESEDYTPLDENDWSGREQASAERVWKDCYRWQERVEYIREHRSQFEPHDWQDLLGCVRGRYFLGYASELLN